MKKILPGFAIIAFLSAGCWEGYIVSKEPPVGYWPRWKSFEEVSDELMGKQVAVTTLDGFERDVIFLGITFDTLVCSSATLDTSVLIPVNSLSNIVEIRPGSDSSSTGGPLFLSLFGALLGGGLGKALYKPNSTAMGALVGAGCGGCVGLMIANSSNEPSRGEVYIFSEPPGQRETGEECRQ